MISAKPKNKATVKPQSRLKARLPFKTAIHLKGRK